MRSVEDLKEIGLVYDISQDGKYQKVIDAVKRYEEANLPQGVWSAEEKPLSWSEIEEITWKLLVEKSRDIKLFTYWVEATLIIQGLQALPDILSIAAKVFDSRSFKGQEEGYKQSLAVYLDKHLSSALSKLNLNFSGAPVLISQIEQFTLENYTRFQHIINLVNDETAMQLQMLYDSANANFENLTQFLKRHDANNLGKTHRIIQLINSFLEYRAAMHEKQNEAEQEALVEPKDPNDIRNLQYYKDAAYTSINEGLQILERVDPQNLVVPFLHKVMRWQHMTLLEIFEDIGTAAEIEAFIKILKEKKSEIEF